MARICIVEDSLDAAKRRYGFLAKTLHEVHVVFDNTEVNSRYVDILWPAAGFDLNRVRYGLEGNFPDADLYFVDGLKGDCFRIIDKVGKDRAYINSSDFQILARAEDEGYKVTWKPQEIVERLS